MRARELRREIGRLRARIAIVVAVALGVLGTTATAARAADESSDRRPLVVVQGEAEIRVAPDRAFVTLSVESRDKDPKVAQRQNATAMAAVAEKLRGAGIAGEAVRTLAFQLDLEIDWQQGKRIPRGYVARNSIEARIDDVGRVGEVIDLAVGAGANDVTGVRFDLKDRAEVEREALRRAVADARARAEAAAAGAGVELGPIERIEQQGTSDIPRPFGMEMRSSAMAAEAAPTTTISAGEITVSSRVVLGASIRPKPNQ